MIFVIPANAGIQLIPDRALEFHDETMPKEAHKVKVRPGTGREAGLGHAHFCSMCGPNFCSNEDDVHGRANTEEAMDGRDRCTQDVRDYAAQQGVEVEVAPEEGLKKKAEEFKKKGSEIYQEV